METINKSQYDDLIKENERLQGKLDKITAQNNQLLRNYVKLIFLRNIYNAS